ncbi:type IV pilus modification PilV family protein [Alteromonas confluentis]|uniref:Prepilin-type N-terminal cleavage/methylation domain-containing protein n=1 Tax=Alteromonas confluentis TaxID=1656094 RepID=A0A1E7ZC95_9ALTE|nr:prepilin-type N-terminal cleavage/methylation domain-containing protein [Alteromonas confluentis]OFC71145.1 hypothetical protein BFC18_09680 [Alteromonas confluentis]
MNASRGFTLLETVIGLAIFAIVMATTIQMIAEQSRRSMEPIWQSRAAELARSILSEAQNKKFDTRSSSNPADPRCNENGSRCSQTNELGPGGGEQRQNWDDFDDFHRLYQVGADITDSRGVRLVNPDGSAMYEGFALYVRVHYDDNTDGIDDDDLNQDGVYDTGTYVGNVKRMVVYVNTPGGDWVRFSAIRWNIR